MNKLTVEVQKISLQNNERKKDVSKKFPQPTYSFANHSHLNRIVFYTSKSLLLTLSDDEQRIRMEFPPCIIGRMRFILKQSSRGSGFLHKQHKNPTNIIIEQYKEIAKAHKSTKNRNSTLELDGSVAAAAVDELGRVSRLLNPSELLAFPTAKPDS